MQDKNLRKTETKLLILLVKWFPLIIAVFQFINLITQFFTEKIIILDYIACTSVLSLIFLYLCSYVFKFCFYHRISLHYLVITQLMCVIDKYIGIPITTEQLFWVHINLFCSLLVILLYFKFK